MESLDCVLALPRPGHPLLPQFSGAKITAKMLKPKRQHSLCVALAVLPLPTELCCCINNGADTAPSGIMFPTVS